MIALIRKSPFVGDMSRLPYLPDVYFFHQREVKRRYCIRAHILSAVSDHYYSDLFCAADCVLLSCFSFIDDDGEPVILRFQSYHSYFLKK